MNPYSSYKDSGVEWIGEIPSHWNSIKLKYIGFLYGGLSGKSGKDFNDDDNPNNKPFIPFTNICDNTYISKNNLGMVSISEDDKQNRVEKNDLFFLMSSEDQEGIGKPSVLKDDLGEVYLNTFCRGFRIIDEKYDSLFVNYLLSGHSYRELLSVEGRGFTRINLRSHKVSDFQIYYPPIETQTQIVSFLDTKTQKIDELIEKTEQKIELLKEKRTSLINHCVTKGLNPNVEMKDSGVEWIGEIPSHWDFIPTKYFTIQNKGIQTGPFGTQLNTKDYVDNGVKVMNQKTLIDEDYDIGEEFISYEKYKDLRVFEVLEGDMIMGTRGSFGKGKRTTFGKISIVPKGLGDCVLHPCLIRIRLKENLILKNYYYFYINDSTFFLDDIRNTSNSTTIEVIYGVTLKDIKIPVPPVEEQNQILIYINKQTQKIDSTIKKETQRIELLKEYRQSLISEVVTGKVDVRGWNGN